MEKQIREILIRKLKEYHANFTVPHYDDEIIKVTTFNAIELDYNDLGNICGQTSFICNVKGKIPGITFRNRTYSFTFSGIEAIMDGTRIIDLNIENIVISPYEKHA